MSVLMDTRVGCYGVVVEDGRLLLAHWNEGGMVAWTLPGGGLDPGEQPEGCVVRELREETDGTTDETRWVALDEVAGLDRVDLVDVAIQMLEA